jgi:hypothetical protein
MKIDLQSIDQTQFMVHEHIINGEICALVQPQHVGCEWTQANKIFRSSLWNFEGELISAGFPKFTNWGEKPDQFPVPKNLKGTKIMEKMDGSLLIVSKYHSNFIVRTRGTVDARNLEKNGHEIQIFKDTILPKLEEFQGQGTGEEWGCSFLFEWTSPLQRIVLNYGEQPEWYLVGIILHGNYHLQGQEYLDYVANSIGVKRPIVYDFPDVDTLLKEVDMFQGKEGVCVYSNNDQDIHLVLHHMKSELSSLEKVMDVWIAQGRPAYQHFFDYVSTTFDFELAEQCRGHISNICDGYKEVEKIVEHMISFVEPLKTLARKDAALKILGAYGETNRKSFCFTLLDGKPVDDEGIKKLMFQVLKK